MKLCNTHGKRPVFGILCFQSHRFLHVLFGFKWHERTGAYRACVRCAVTYVAAFPQDHRESIRV